MTLCRVWHKKLASSHGFQNNSVLFSLMQVAIIVISPQMYKVKKKKKQISLFLACPMVLASQHHNVVYSHAVISGSRIRKFPLSLLSKFSLGVVSLPACWNHTLLLHQAWKCYKSFFTHIPLAGVTVS